MVRPYCCRQHFNNLLHMGILSRTYLEPSPLLTSIHDIEMYSVGDHKCKPQSNKKALDLQLWLGSKIHHCNSGTKSVWVTSKHLIGFKVYIMRCNLWVFQGSEELDIWHPRNVAENQILLNSIDIHERNTVVKWFLMTFCYIHRWVFCPSCHERSVRRREQIETVNKVKRVRVLNTQS